MLLSEESDHSWLESRLETLQSLNRLNFSQTPELIGYSHQKREAKKKKSSRLWMIQANGGGRSCWHGALLGRRE